MKIGQGDIVKEIHDMLFDPGTDLELPETMREIPRHLAFMAAAVQLERVYGGGATHRKELVVLHDLMYFLLMGRHPITNYQRDSDFRKPTKETDPRQMDLMTDEYRETYQELLDFTHPKRPGVFYKLLTILLNLKKCYRRYTPDKVGLEQITVFMLGLAVIDTPKTFDVDETSDLLTVKTLLALYANFPEFKQVSVDPEHIAFSDMYIGNSATGHLGILSGATKRMFAMHLPMETILTHIAYLARFCALMRTASMLSVFQQYESWNDCLRASVSHMAFPARKLVDEMALKIEAPPVIRSVTPDLTLIASRFPHSSRFHK